jgi:Protein of unknown function (DUF4446)
VPDPSSSIPVLAALLVAALVGVGLLWRQVGGLRSRLDALTRGADGQSVEDVLTTHLGRVVEVQSDMHGLAERTARLEAEGRSAFSRIGLVRFNPFDDTGGNQSFALALLDADEDGLIISSLHSRGATRIYAKAISAGRPEATLSDEETEALTQARHTSKGRAGLGARAGLAARAGAARAAAARDRGGSAGPG